jgi:hypothetical protein
LPDTNAADDHPNVAFVTDSNDILVINNPGNFRGTISNFLVGDTIDLTGIGTATGAILGANNVLTVHERDRSGEHQRSR